MRSIYLTAPRVLEVREEPIPAFGNDEILVKVAYCGICTLEQRLYTGKQTIGYPIIPGHEASGVVAAVGNRVKTRVSCNDHVVLDLVNRCHACAACLTGRSNLCENRYRSGQRVLGAFSEYVAVRPEQVLVIPPSLSLEQAALTEPLACCIRSLKKTNVGLGSTLLIIGAGTMGLLHLKVALAMGVRVIVSDIVGDRISAALEMGSDAVIDAADRQQLVETVNQITAGRGVDGCIITTPAAGAIDSVTEVLAPGGTLTIYTSYPDTPAVPVDMNTIHRNEYVITGTEGREQEDFYTAMRAMTNRKVFVGDLISGIYPIEEVSEALEQALSGSTYRVLLKLES